MNAAGHSPDVASAANISAFTSGSAMGIYLGGVAIDGGRGLASVNWVGGRISTAGLVVAVLSWLLMDRRSTSEPQSRPSFPRVSRHPMPGLASRGRARVTGRRAQCSWFFGSVNSWVCGFRWPSVTAPRTFGPLRRKTLRPSVMWDS